MVRLAASACRPGLNTLTLSDLHSRLVVDGSSAHAFLDLSCHRQEGLLHVRGILGRRLQEGNSKAISEFLKRPVC